MKIQNTLNSDIAMQLDDVIRPCSPKTRHLEAVKRSIRWLDRCLNANRNDKQMLFPIIQGGLHEDLRTLSVDEILKCSPKGIAIGGLCGGEDKKMFCSVVFNTVNYLRRRLECPVYVMGVGYPEDVVISIMLGSDMSDCVYPTRTARFGRMFSDYGDINIHSFKDYERMNCTGHSETTEKKTLGGTFECDGLVWNDCRCKTCGSFSLNFLKMIRNTPNFCILLTEHNLFYMRGLTERIRQGIERGNLDVFIKGWIDRRYNGNVPDWVKYAYELVGI